MAIKYRLNRTLGPASEPVTTAEAKDHLELSASDTTHDSKVGRAITAAREQFEADTGYVCITQTYTVSFDCFPSSGDSVYLPVRPAASISSITYYDINNASQTLATSVYGLDTSSREVYLKYNQEWPDVTEQHNGCVITCTAGFGAASNVPALIKSAVLLQVGKWFYQRDMTENTVFSEDRAYERIVNRLLRTSYP